MRAREDLERPALADLAALDDAQFRTLFAGSPVKRIGHGRFLRNVLIAIGNSGDLSLLPLAEARLAAEDPLVRGAAIWALRKLDPERSERLLLDYLPAESDKSVQAEWTGDI